MIETTVDNKNDLTIHKCLGSLTDNEFITVIHTFYDGKPTMNTAWDFSKCSLDGTSSVFLKQAANLVHRLSQNTRKGGKTAVIASQDLEYGLSRMFQIITEDEGIPFNIKVFRTADEASQWLLEKE